MISKIVATTNSCIDNPRAEVTRNEDVHGRILDLAVSNAAHVEFENITQASILKSFVPEMCTGAKAYLPQAEKWSTTPCPWSLRWTSAAALYALWAY